MAAYFLDSSAAVKLHVEERGTAWLTALVDPARGNELLIARMTLVEIAAALYRRVDTGTLGVDVADGQVRVLSREVGRTYVVVELTVEDPNEHEK